VEKYKQMNKHDFAVMHLFMHYVIRHAQH